MCHVVISCSPRMESLSILLTLIRPLIQTSFDVSLHWNWRRWSWNIRSSQEELRLLSICHQDQLAVLSRAGSMRITQVAQYDTSLSFLWHYRPASKCARGAILSLLSANRSDFVTDNDRAAILSTVRSKNNGRDTSSVDFSLSFPLFSLAKRRSRTIFPWFS